MNELEPIGSDQETESKIPLRLQMGEAYMMCENCGAKLYSFDGYQDASRKCPFWKNGQCQSERGGEH